MQDIEIKQYNATVRQNQSFFRETQEYRKTLTYIKDAKIDQYSGFKEMLEDLQKKAREVLL